MQEQLPRSGSFTRRVHARLPKIREKDVRFSTLVALVTIQLIYFGIIVTVYSVLQGLLVVLLILDKVWDKVALLAKP